MKRLVVLAGPNGSGKTSVFNEVKGEPEFPKLYICPDNIVENFEYIEDERERYIKAAKESENLRHIAIENELSFSFETVFSTKDKLDFINFSKENGYFIEIVYITTKNPNINIERVRGRVSKGGHSVPAIKIISRYHKSMKLLSEVIKIADSVKVYDNSDSSPIIVFLKTSGNELRLLNKEKRDKWVKEYIVKPLIETGFINEWPKDLTVEETKHYLANVNKKRVKSMEIDF